MKKLALTDFAKYRYPSALELSPDSRYLTFALKDVDREGDGYRWNLWLYDLERRESRQITQGDDQRKAVWEDNTHILYKTTEPDEALRARGFEEEWTVYHRLNVCTGEDREAFRLPMSVSGLWKMDDGRYVFTGETHLDRPNLLELTGEALEKELVRRQQTRGYKVLTELPLCENGVGMFNQTRNTLFLYLEAAGEYRRITPEDYDVNHVNVRPGQVLFTAFPFRDVKPVTEGMYRWDCLLYTSLGIRHGVGQSDAALGIGVVHLNIPPGHGTDHIARHIGRGGELILASRHHAGNIDPKAPLLRRPQGGHHRDVYKRQRSYSHRFHR